MVLPSTRAAQFLKVTHSELTQYRSAELAASQRSAQPTARSSHASSYSIQHCYDVLSTADPGSTLSPTTSCDDTRTRLMTRASRPERSFGWLSRTGGHYLTSVTGTLAFGLVIDAKNTGAARLA